MRIRSALEISFGLHLAAMTAILATVRMGAPMAFPNVMMVDWIESLDSAGNESITASPNQSPGTKQASAPYKPAPRQEKSGLVPTRENAAPAASEYSAELRARRMSLEESYAADVQKTLERIKIYPPLARRLGQTGQVTLKFKVGIGGEVMDSEITGPSPFPVLNEAAKTLIASAHFPPIPAELQRSNLEFIYSVKYVLD